MANSKHSRKNITGYYVWNSLKKIDFSNIEFNPTFSEHFIMYCNGIGVQENCKLQKTILHN